MANTTGFLAPARCVPFNPAHDDSRRGCGQIKRAVWARHHRRERRRLRGGAGQRVLLFDLDPQANATSGLGWKKLEGSSAYRPSSAKERWRRKSRNRLGPAGDHPQRAGHVRRGHRIARLDNHVQRVKLALQPVVDSAGRFDVIVIDCPRRWARSP